MVLGCTTQKTSNTRRCMMMDFIKLVVVLGFIGVMAFLKALAIGAGFVCGMALAIMVINKLIVAKANKNSGEVTIEV